MAERGRLTRRCNTVSAWLGWLEGLHPTEIELGLERVAAVYQAMGQRRPAPTIIVVAGTNGKGSTISLLEAIYLAAGYRVGAYTSPHLLRYNERIRLHGREVDDTALCHAFAAVDQVRADISLTYFEFGTLAALALFEQAELDIVLLEVGLGGRLDAVNIVDADVAVISNISIDHVAWLGPDRESIAREKAGIMRAQRPVVYGESHPPASLVETARALDSPLYCRQVDFASQLVSADDAEVYWRWHDQSHSYEHLPLPALVGEFQLANAATAIKAVSLLQSRLAVDERSLALALTSVHVAGRFQQLQVMRQHAADIGRHGELIPLILDVAHNPAAAQVLAATLQHQLGFNGRTHCILAMLADKDITAVLTTLVPVVDHWYLAEPAAERACPVSRLAAAMPAGVKNLQTFTGTTSVAAALTQAVQQATAVDRIVVCGSFYTVSSVMQNLTADPGGHVRLI